MTVLRAHAREAFALTYTTSVGDSGRVLIVAVMMAALAVAMFAAPRKPRIRRGRDVSTLNGPDRRKACPPSRRKAT